MATTCLVRPYNRSEEGSTVPRRWNIPVSNSGNNMDGGGILRDTGFLNYVHRRGTSTNKENIRFGELCRLTDVIVVLDGERCRLLAGKYGHIGVHVVSSDV